MQLHNTIPTDTPPTMEDDLFRRMLDQRRVMLTGAVDGKLAERICAQLLVLEADVASPPTTSVDSPDYRAAFIAVRPKPWSTPALAEEVTRGST